MYLPFVGQGVRRIYSLSREKANPSLADCESYSRRLPEADSGKLNSRNKNALIKGICSLNKSVFLMGKYNIKKW